MPSSGRIDGGQSIIIKVKLYHFYNIKVSFNPLQPGEIKHKVPLYLDNDFKNAYQMI